MAALPASAEEPATLGAPQVGAGLRFGIDFEEGDINPWGLGIGIEGGYTLSNQIYVGGTFEYFFGDSQDLGGGNSLDTNLWHLMVEGGYDLGLSPEFVLRPKLGLGIASVNAEACVGGFGCASDSESKFALAPGVKGLYALDNLLLSADVRYIMVLADNTVNGMVFSLGAGYMF